MGTVGILQATVICWGGLKMPVFICLINSLQGLGPSIYRMNVPAGFRGSNDDKATNSEEIDQVRFPAPQFPRFQDLRLLVD